jgi:hypothetical protein
MRVASYNRFLFFALVLLALSAASYAQVGIGISVNFAPPALPVYEQPPCPSEGYIWTPGYWAWDADDADYYWVPGTWVLAPEVGYLWTPAWWGWSGGAYLFHAGWWGPHVGFYGGIAYGFGYFGNGYEGGRWDGGHFFYNRSVNNINVTNIHNVYNTTVVNSTTVNRVSYNGGSGGINARPTSEDQRVEGERHLPPAPVQRQQEQSARANPQQRASVNQGRPAIAATAKPGDFKGGVPAREAGAPYHAPAERGGTEAARPENRGNEPAGRPESAPRAENEARTENNVPRPPATHAKELQPHQPATVPSTGNASRDQKYQQQQAKLAQKQNQEHQKLQQQQEQEHQRVAQNNANAARTQQLEQKHQQQTAQLEQKHTQQQQHLQQKQQPAKPKGK